MTRFVGAMLVTSVVLALPGLATADDAKDVQAILDKAIKALGGEEKLAAVKAATWKSKGKVSFGGNDGDFTSQATLQSLDRFRQEFEGDFNSNKVKAVVVLNGDKGWRQFADMTVELDKDALANQKRVVYLAMVPTTLVPLKGKEFKVGKAVEEKVDGKPAIGLEIVGPDGKDFKLYFDKESGLPVREVAKVKGLQGEEYEQETNFGNYKEFDGIKKATKIDTKRDGVKFVESEITEFKVLKEVDPKTFAEPK
jgi:hypothetical protein